MGFDWFFVWVHVGVVCVALFVAAIAAVWCAVPERAFGAGFIRFAFHDPPVRYKKSRSVAGWVCGVVAGHKMSNAP